MKFEEEIEELLKGSVAGLAELGPIIEASDNESVELFRVLQRQLRLQGKAILRLAAAIDGLSLKSE